MGNKTTALAIVLFSLMLVNIASAYGYGTSSISLASSSASLRPGNGTSVGYTVSLASGSMWGTTLSVANSGQLATEGITVSLSNTYADPTYTGTMSVGTSKTAHAGSYSVVLTATGDDPSTSNATFALTVLAPPATTVQTTISNTTKSQTTTVQTTVIPLTTIATTTKNYTAVTGYYGAVSGSAAYASSALIVILVIAALYGIYVWKSRLARLVIMGAALILIGTVAWLYGDYAGGLQGYIWGGFAAVVIGTIVWVYGDAAGGTFGQREAGRLAYAGIALIVIGAIVWIYGELAQPGIASYWWAGTVLLVVGTFVWLYGDVRAGAFLRRSR